MNVHLQQPTDNSVPGLIDRDANAQEEKSLMAEGDGDFLKPTTIERIFNGAFGLIVRFGGGLKYNYELEVRGRKSGKVFRTPVNLLEFKSRRFLIGTRGETQWARN